MTGRSAADASLRVSRCGLSRYDEPHFVERPPRPEHVIVDREALSKRMIRRQVFDASSAQASQDDKRVVRQIVLKSRAERSPTRVRANSICGNPIPAGLARRAFSTMPFCLGRVGRDELLAKSIVLTLRPEAATLVEIRPLSLRTTGSLRRTAMSQSGPGRHLPEPVPLPSRGPGGRTPTDPLTFVAVEDDRQVRPAVTPAEDVGDGRWPAGRCYGLPD